MNQTVNRIWESHDRKGDGYLSLEESRTFIRDSFGNAANSQFSDKDIEIIFAKIDTDGDGRINKGEMARFLMQITKF